jgi:hypothetical protein
VAAAGLVGLGLSAPAWLMLREYLAETFRGNNRQPFSLNWDWIVPPWGLPGLLYPGFSTVWNVFGGWHPHMGVELAGGLVPVTILAAACGYGRRALWRHRYECGLLLASLALAMGPSVGQFRWSFRWLPLFFLVLGLTAAHVLANLRAAAGGGRPNLGLLAAALASLGWLAAFPGMEDDERLFTHGPAVLAVCLAWAAVERWAPAWGGRRWLPCAVVLACALVFYADVDGYMEVPYWDLDAAEHPEGLDPARRYLRVCFSRDVYAGPARGAGLLPGNSALYSGVEFVNGYSPMYPRGLDAEFDLDVHGCFAPDKDEKVKIPERVRRLLTEDTRPGALLELLGVDGLLVAQRFAGEDAALQANGWRPAATRPGATVYHRLGPPSPRLRSLAEAHVATEYAEAERLHRRAGGPWVLLAETAGAGPPVRDFAPAELAEVVERRNEVTVQVRNPDPRREALVMFARPWYPGYRATLDGAAVPVERLNLFLPAVRVPPGAGGRLVLQYRPPSFVRGMWLAAGTAVGLLALTLGSLVALRMRRYGANGGVSYHR